MNTGAGAWAGTGAASSSEAGFGFVCGIGGLLLYWLLSIVSTHETILRSNILPLIIGCELTAGLQQVSHRKYLKWSTQKRRRDSKLQNRIPCHTISHAVET